MSDEYSKDALKLELKNFTKTVLEKLVKELDPVIDRIIGDAIEELENKDEQNKSD